MSRNNAPRVSQRDFVHPFHCAFHLISFLQRTTLTYLIGETVDHGTAKELLAAFAAGETDKLCETKGLDFIDREKAKRQASEHAQNMYDEQYGGQDQYDPNSTQNPF